MKFFSFTKYPAYLPKDVWLHQCPLYEGAEPLWTGCTTSNKWAEGHYKNAASLANFTLSAPPFAVCTVKLPQEAKYVEEGELWFDLDTRTVWDVNGIIVLTKVKQHLAEFGIKITLTKIQGLVLGASKDELLAQISEWNKLAEKYLLNKKFDKLSAVPPTFFDFDLETTMDPPPADPEPMSSADLMVMYKAKKYNIKQAPATPYKWILSNGTIIRTDVPEASQQTLSNDF